MAVTLAVRRSQAPRVALGFNTTRGAPSKATAARSGSPAFAKASARTSFIAPIQLSTGSHLRCRRRAMSAGAASRPVVKCEHEDDADGGGWKDLLGEQLWAPRAGNLHISSIQERELLAVADLQATGFFTSSQPGLLNAVAWNSFRAEVRSALSQKIKYSDPQSFCCLVAKNEKDEHVGVVEVSIQSDPKVVSLMDTDCESYAYIASMTVREEERRGGIATSLLSAAEQMAVQWGQQVVVLDVHEDNTAAVGLYTARGYTAAREDPGWYKLIGKRKRINMHKGLNPV